MIRSWIQYIPSWITALWAWKPFLEIDYICQIQKRQAGTFKNQFTMISWWYIHIVVKVISPFEAPTAHRMATLISPQDFPVMGLFGSTEYHAEKHRTLIRAQKPEKQKKTGDTKSAPNERFTHWSMRFLGIVITNDPMNPMINDVIFVGWDSYEDMFFSWESMTKN